MTSIGDPHNLSQYVFSRASLGGWKLLYFLRLFNNLAILLTGEGGYYRFVSSEAQLRWGKLDHWFSGWNVRAYLLIWEDHVLCSKLQLHVLWARRPMSGVANCCSLKPSLEKSSLPSYKIVCQARTSHNITCIGFFLLFNERCFTAIWVCYVVETRTIAT